MPLDASIFGGTPNDQISSDLMQRYQPGDGGPFSTDPEALKIRLARKMLDAPPPTQVDFSTSPPAPKPAATTSTATSSDDDEEDKTDKPDLSSFGTRVTGQEPKADLSSFGQPVQDTQPLGVSGNLVAAGKGLLRGAPEAVGSMSQGAAVLAGPMKPISPEGMSLVDELENSGNLDASGRAKLMGRALRTLPDRGMQMDYNAALQRIAQGSDAATEAQAIRNKFNLRNADQDKPIQEQQRYKAGTAIKDWIDKAVPMSDIEKSSVGGTVGTGVSSMAPYLAAGVLVGPEAGVILGAGGMGTQTAGDTFQAAKAKGATDEQAATAAGWSGAVGAALGTLPLGTVFKPVAQASPGMKAWMAAKLVQAGQSGVVFAGVGEAQDYLLQQIAKEQYDPQAGYSPDAKRVISSLLTGGILGTMHPLSPKPADISSPEAIADFLRRSAEAAGKPARTPEEQAAYERGTQTRADIDEFMRQQAQQEAATAPALPAPSAEPPSATETTPVQESMPPVPEPPPAHTEPVQNQVPTEQGIIDALKRYGLSDQQVADMSPRARQEFYQEAFGDQQQPATPGEPDLSSFGERVPGQEPTPIATELVQKSEGEVAPVNKTPGTREAPIKATTGTDVALAQPAEPKSQAQAEAENYKHAHVELDQLGLTGRNSISIETGAGQIRRGIDPDGKPWQVQLPVAYGRIKGTEGADGQPLDIFVGPQPTSPHVFIVDQHNPGGGAFDEHKILAGFPDPQSALRAYANSYDDQGGDRIGHVTALTPDQFKTWLHDGDTKAPLKGATIAAAPEVIPPQKIYAEPTREHHAQIEAVLGRDYEHVLPADAARAAEILAESPSISPEMAFQHAVIENAHAHGLLSADELENIYGEPVRSLLEPERAPEGRAPIGREENRQEPASGGAQASELQGRGPASPQAPEAQGDQQPDARRATARAAAQERTRAKGTKDGREVEPQNLLQFIAAKGGLAPHPELSALDAHKHTVQMQGFPPRRKLVKDGGLALDMAREAAEEAGYLKGEHNQTSTIRNLLDAIDEGMRGQHRYPEGLEGTKTRQEIAAEHEAADHYEAVYKDYHDQLAEAGYEELSTDIRDRAVSLMARDGLDADRAVDSAIMQMDAEKEAATPAEFDDTFGHGAFDAIEESFDLPAAHEDGHLDRSQGEEGQRPEEARVGGAGDRAPAVGEEAREPTFEAGVDNRQQAVIPGAERASDKTMAQRGADAALRPKAPQKATDFGLFGDESKQTDLLDALQARESGPSDSGKPPPEESSPHLSDAEIGDIFDELIGDKRSTAEVAASAARNAIAAADKALSGLTKLFGTNTMGAGLHFDEETYAQAKPLFQDAAERFADSKGDIRELMRRMIDHLKEAYGWTTDMLRNARPYVVRFIQDVQSGEIDLNKPRAEAQEPAHAPSSSPVLERGRGEPADQDRVGAADISAPAGADGSRVGEGGGAPDRGDERSSSGERVSQDYAPAVGERGNLELPERQPDATGSDAPNRELGRSDTGGAERLPPERTTTEQAIGHAQEASDVNARRRLQQQANARNIEVKSGNLGNIAETLPMLFPEQHEDVRGAEERYSKPEGHGMLFTNGTGTGKTYSGLGVIKRFELQGKKNALVIAPSQGILLDWQRQAKDLGLDMHILDSTQDNGGEGFSGTTYANLGANKTLADREWDLVVPDESHKISSDQSGTVTEALSTLRAITKHPNGLRDRARMVLRSDYDRIEHIPEGQKAAAYAAFQKKAEPLIAKWRTEERPKVLMMSATPFAYHKSLDYAEGYLFNYDRDRSGAGYNSGDGRDAFFMQHLGYRMRNNKLTRPDADVKQEVMERQLHEHLKREGSLSGRMLTVDKDYDRKFVLTHDAVGHDIDRAMRFLTEEDDGKFRPLYDAINKRFDYLSRMRLLEAIKAKAAIPYIKQSFALARKVVVFHDYNEGGGIDPFDLSFGPEQKFTRWQDGKTVETNAQELYDEFLQRNPYVKDLNFADYPAPIETLKEAFPDALIYNGTVPNKERNRAKALFNDDNSGNNIIIVQSAAGEAGISLHDTTGKHQRTLLNLGMPVRPTTAIQQEGRIYRVGQASNAAFRYMNTGTDWERWTFAGKIAERAGTAENLALGDQARAIRSSFVDAFSNSEEYPPSVDDGTGGKEADRSISQSVSEFDKAKTHYFAQAKTSGRRDAREGMDYYGTPEPLGLKMVEWANMRSGEKELEPSAGHGAIARYFPEDTHRTLVEPSSNLASRAALVSPGSRVVVDRFENLDPGANKADGIVMNPPFGRSGKTAIDHVQKAVKHLRNGGRIVALIPRGATDARFDEFMDSDAAKGVHLVGDVKLPPVTFERAGTSVATRVVVLEKQTDPDIAAQIQQRSRDYSDAKTISELFDRIENTEMAPRLEPRTVEAEASTAGRVTIGGTEFELSGKDAPFLAEPRSRIGGGFGDMARLAEANDGRWDRSARGFVFGTQEGRQAFLDAVAKPPAERSSAAKTEPIHGVTFKTGETKHSKTGDALFVATPNERVERTVYDRMAAAAKAQGGWYSSFRGRGAIPGFQFKSAEARQAFLDAAAGKKESQTLAAANEIFNNARMSDKTIRLYHGTTPEGFRGITDSGMIDGPAFFTPSRRIAEQYAANNGGDEDTVFAVDVPVSQIKIDLDMPGARLMSPEEAASHLDRPELETVQDFIDAGYSVGTRESVPIDRRHEDKSQGGPGKTGASAVSEVVNRLNTKLGADKVNELQQELRSIVRQVAGPGFDVAFERGLIRDTPTVGYGASMENAGAIGQYRLDEPLIRLAMTGSRQNMAEAAYHEAYHAVEDKLLTEPERGLMQQETPRLREWIKGKTGLGNERVDQLAGYEVRAIAFQLYERDRAAGTERAGAGIHFMVRRAFDRLAELFHRVKNALAGYGLRTYRDIFGAAHEGEFSGREHQEGHGINTSSLDASWNIFRSEQDDAVNRRIADVMESASLFDRIKEKAVDLNTPVRRLEDAIAARMAGELPDSQAFYRKKRLFPGKVAAEVQDFNRRHLDPLIDTLKQKGMNLSDVGDILYAQHAEERNAYIDTINPDMNGMGSGMSNEEAQQILGRYSPREIDEINKHVDGIRDFTLNTMADAGLESKSTIAGWKEQYQNYVPLGGFEEPLEGAQETFREPGKFNVRGPEVRQALGRQSRANNPLVNLLDQAYRTIERAKKNEYLQSLNLALRELGPDDRKGFVTFDKGKPRRTIDQKTGLVHYVDDSSYRYSPKAVAYKVGGGTHYMVFENQATADAIRRMHADGLGAFQPLLNIENKLKAMWTHYSPEFLIRHFIFRYPIEGTLNAFEQGAREVPHYIADATPFLGRASRAIFASNRGEESTNPEVAQLQREWGQMRKAGGAMAFRQARDINLLREHLEKKLASISGKPLDTVKAKHQAAVEAMDTITNALDNSLRLAAYATARRQGKTPEQAAVIARDASIDFQQAGLWKNKIGLWFPFGNVAIQTGARMGSAVYRSKTMRAVFGGTVAAGFMTAMFNYLVGGNDKDGIPYIDKIPEWDKHLNMTVINPFHHDAKGRAIPIHIPLPYNWAWPFAIGQTMGTMAFSKTKGEKQKMLGMATKSGIEVFTPFASEANLAAIPLPELLRTPAHVYTNQNWSGVPIHLDPAFQKGPRSESGRKATGDGWKYSAQMLNTLSGGDKHHSGYLDFFPEDIREMADYYSGLGTQRKFAQNVATTAKNVATGQPTDYSHVPFARVVVGADYDAADRARHYERLREERRPWEH